jgi:hypothetical protein
LAAPYAAADRKAAAVVSTTTGSRMVIVASAGQPAKSPRHAPKASVRISSSGAKGRNSMIRCTKFRAFEKNTLKGFADFELTRLGLIIRDCPFHRKNDREWIGFPARSYEAKDGTIAWQPLVEFAEGAAEARRQFQEQAVAAIHQFVDEQNAEVAP